MSAMSPGERKRVLRAGALSQRNALTRTQALSLSRLVQERALRFAPYLAARAIALYSSIETEVATEAIRDHAWENGKKVFFPKLGYQKRPELTEARVGRDFRRGRFGILEPAGDTPLDRREQALVFFVPGVAFDVRGNRLGRGIGWYDRLLQDWDGKATFVGLAYDFQIVGEVPAEPWDQQVHYLITERRVIRCGATPSVSTQVS
jgi:5-formyltetrahydrofolate cyclo-ligase